MNRPRTIALALTALIAIGMVALMMAVHLSTERGDREWPPVRDNEVALVEDNFFDVVEVPAPVTSAYEVASPAENPVTADNNSTPEPTTGTDMHDAGHEATAPSPVTSTRRSPVSEQARRSETSGPSREEQAAEEARRRATAATSAAFDRSRGSDNAQSAGSSSGQSGTPEGSGSFHGRGHGTVNGGWKFPAYAEIPATTTGAIRVRATIDRTGRVTEVTLLNGTPPAGSDPALRKAVVEEVKRRKFTRGDNQAPDRATALITYTFK